MSKVVTTTLLPDVAGGTVTLGGTGDSVVATGNDIRTNVLQDAGGNAVFTSNGSGVMSGMNSAFAGALNLLSTQTASNAASVSFTTGIDSTYDVYIFKFVDVNPASDGAEFQWQANAVGASGFNETITSTYYLARHTEDGNTTTGPAYDPGNDQDQGTAYQYIAQGVGSEADESAVGELFLFNPSSTTYVKQFYSTSAMTQSGTQAAHDFSGGYINTTAAIDEISFKFSTGNLDAVIKMYGLG